MTNFDYVANLTDFLMSKGESVIGSWSGRLTAAEQRALFGQFLGKGLLVIDGSEEDIQHWSACRFGGADITKWIKWKDLGR